jgi:predicted enzyme involved in methoxymalonyl-ACP biosynthesis
MSCRVLGRGVEAATLNLIVAQARALGATHLRGEYRPTAKNAMVREHYTKLGFIRITQTEEGGSVALLDLASFEALPTCIETIEGPHT